MSRLYRAEAGGSTKVLEQFEVEVVLAQRQLARSGFRSREAMARLQGAAERTYYFAKAIGYGRDQR